MLGFTGFSFKGYKSFSKNEYTEINEIKNLNCIIGKNNSGKSSFIDIINFISDIEKFNINKSRFSDIEMIIPLSEKSISIVFPKNVSGGIIGGNHYEFGKSYINKDLRVSIYPSARRNTVFAYKPSQIQIPELLDQKFKNFLDDLCTHLEGNLPTYKFRRLDSERNIISEIETSSENLESNGNGASNLVRKFINHSNYNEKFIETELLNALNKIMKPEANFTNIRVQQIDFQNQLLWEIFLEEKDVGRFALSESGSGLKTIILILLNLLIIPKTNEYKDNTIIYAFEELENNLHPALQRKVFDYLYDYSINNDVCIFLTTHSHVAINTFYEKDHAQILHVSKNSGVSTLKLIDNYIDKAKILDDLDVRASDLLQSNGIIWVEGPSDRIYIKQWLEVLCECKFEEGKHYQFLYYGGKLLAHYSANNEMEDFISILLTNRNSAIVIDSDKKNRNAKINETKNRIKSEFENSSLLCWITQGKEIENYVSKDAISSAFEVDLKKQCEIYELFPKYIKSTDPSFINHKVSFATKIAPYITKENSKTILDLEKKIRKLFKCIESWNKESN